MQDTGTREPTIRKGTKTSPGADATAITPTAQRLKPMLYGSRPERLHTGQVAGESMIVQVALHPAAKPGP
jgi:hypothetical protein